MAQLLAFAPFSSSIDPSFWQALTDLKIDRLKLDDSAVACSASYARGRTVRDRESGQEVPLGCLASLDSTAFAAETPRPASFADLPVELRGELINYNTIEAFRAADKASLFQAVVDVLWNRIQADQNVDATSLNPFLLLTFADLKKYKYYYWFAFPALIASSPWQAIEAPALARERLDGQELIALHAAYSTFAQQQPRQAGACLVRKGSGGMQIGTLSEHRSFFAEGHGETYLLFLDPSAHASAPGWPLRNILAYLHYHEGLSELNILLWRDSLGDDFAAATSRTRIVRMQTASTDSQVKPQASGWEKNAAGKLGPRLADLGPMMDPRRLADSAVDLNLKLMRWRILPSLDLERIKETRCLLLGSGTLGCYIARGLLAWGVRNITLVDSARVSFSNPVRQPLFEFEDCLQGGKPKAECAAAALQRIYPGVNAKGVLLNIPMPGHPVPPGSIEMARADVDTLDALIDAHDVVYLLMDSRESRWLPTLLGAAKGKLVINVALGFDSYVVMRHGVAASDRPVGEAIQPGQPYRGQLGCYFCNDIVAPTDSLTDRTLDQMCTVTRPGLAALAGASAVELMVSVLQHVDGAKAHADTESVLGAVPHQLRGYLGRFETLKIVGQAYDRCTGCSSRIVEAYRKEGFELLLRAFADAKALEQATGLDQLQQESAALEDLDWDEAEDIDEDA